MTHEDVERASRILTLEDPRPDHEGEFHLFRMNDGRLETKQPSHTEWHPYEWEEVARALAQLIAEGGR